MERKQKQIFHESKAYGKGRMESSVESKDADHVYYNMNIFNNTLQPIQAAFEENRVIPVIDNPSLYHLSIIRFSMPTGTIPIFNFNQADGYYTVTLSYLGVDYVKPLVFVSESNPSSAGVYSYQHMIDMINTAFLGAFNAMPSGGQSLVGQAPYLTFNPVTMLISMNVTLNYDPVLQATAPLIFMNYNLYSFFETFHTIFNGFNTTHGKDFQFVIENTGNNTATLPAIPPNYAGGAGYSLMQEVQTLFLWASLKAVSFLTGSIPVNTELIAVNSGSGVANFRPIMTDLEPVIQGATDIRTKLQYFPQSEYRLASMTNDTPLKKLDVVIYWNDNQGNQYPVTLAPSQSISIKFLFRKKTFHGGY
jgi:hypothetical protein